MDTAIVQQFLSFFQDYIDLCQTDNWPDNDITVTELRNAFLISEHVEKCLDRLQKRNIISDFLSVLNSYDETSNSLLKNCLTNPPKYILKKIINSNTKIDQMDAGFKLFLEIFSEEKLEDCLTELMLEVASKGTLLRNISHTIPKEKILEFKCKLMLSELKACPAGIPNLFHDCKQETIELFVLCLISKDPQYMNAVKTLADCFLNIVLSKEARLQHFWRLLFKVDDRYLIEMCMENPDIFMYIVEALADCGKLVREGMSSESFYINLNKYELVSVVQRLCKHDALKSQFFNIIKDYDSNTMFWENML